MKKFKEDVIQCDSMAQLKKETMFLLTTTPEKNKNVVKKYFGDFSRLYQRFTEESGTSVDWGKVEKLPAGAVCIILCKHV